MGRRILNAAEGALVYALATRTRLDQPARRHTRTARTTPQEQAMTENQSEADPLTPERMQVLIDDYEKRIQRRDQRLDELEALIRDWDRERTERAAKTARLVSLLRRQVHRLWAYHDWVVDHDCSAVKPSEGYTTASILINRTLHHDGSDLVGVEASEMDLVEALGLLRMAEDTVIQQPEILTDGRDR